MTSMDVTMTCELQCACKSTLTLRSWIVYVKHGPIFTDGDEGQGQEVFCSLQRFIRTIQQWGKLQTNSCAKHTHVDMSDMLMVDAILKTKLVLLCAACDMKYYFLTAPLLPWKCGGTDPKHAANRKI